MASSVTPNNEKKTPLIHEGIEKADVAVKLEEFCVVKLLGLVGITNCVGVLEKCDKENRDGL